MNNKEELIPWFKMPITLRALPFNERAKALEQYEAVHGTYIWEDHFPINQGYKQ